MTITGHAATYARLAGEAGSIQALGESTQRALNELITAVERLEHQLHRIDQRLHHVELQVKYD